MYSEIDEPINDPEIDRKLTLSDNFEVRINVLRTLSDIVEDDQNNNNEFILVISIEFFCSFCCVKISSGLGSILTGTVLKNCNFTFDLLINKSLQELYSFIFIISQSQVQI